MASQQWSTFRDRWVPFNCPRIRCMHVPRTSMHRNMFRTAGASRRLADDRGSDFPVDCGRHSDDECTRRQDRDSRGQPFPARAESAHQRCAAAKTAGYVSLPQCRPLGLGALGVGCTRWDSEHSAWDAPAGIRRSPAVSGRAVRGCEAGNSRQIRILGSRTRPLFAWCVYTLRTYATDQC